MHNLLYGIIAELQTANTTYEEKLKDGSSTDQTISWDVEELKWIFNEGRAHCVDIQACLEHCTAELFRLHNIPSRL